MEISRNSVPEDEETMSAFDGHSFAAATDDYSMAAAVATTTTSSYTMFRGLGIKGDFDINNDEDDDEDDDDDDETIHLSYKPVTC